MTSDHLAAEGRALLADHGTTPAPFYRERAKEWLYENADTLLSALVHLDRMTEVLVKAWEAFAERALMGKVTRGAREMADELDRVLGGQVGEVG